MNLSDKEKIQMALALAKFSGVKPDRCAAVLEAFDPEERQTATPEQLRAVKGITKDDAEKLVQAFQVIAVMDEIRSDEKEDREIEIRKEQGKFNPS